MFAGLKRHHILLIACGIGLLTALLIELFTPPNADLGQRATLGLCAFLALGGAVYLILPLQIEMMSPTGAFGKFAQPSTANALNGSARIAGAVALISAANAYLSNADWRGVAEALVFTLVQRFCSGSLFLVTLARRARQLHPPKV